MIMSQCGTHTRTTSWGLRKDLGSGGGRMGLTSTGLHKYLPIGLWGDSAVLHKRDSLHMLLWTVLSGSVRKRFWLCACNKRLLCQCGCKGRCTYDGIWAVISWMFRALLTMTYPRVDHTGRPFPRGSFRASKAMRPLRIGGACVAKYGDWSWFKAVLGLRGWRGEGGIQEGLLDVQGWIQ